MKFDDIKTGQKLRIVRPSEVAHSGHWINPMYGMIGQEVTVRIISKYSGKIYVNDLLVYWLATDFEPIIGDWDK